MLILEFYLSFQHLHSRPSQLYAFNIVSRPRLSILMPREEWHRGYRKRERS
jgi:hypothetical protein